MHDRELFGQILGMTKPWRVLDVVMKLEDGEVLVFVDRADHPALRCPTCDARCPRHDSRERTWRHLDTCQYRTMVVATVPRVKCKEHGVHQIAVPWAEPGSHFTGLFEAVVISWLKLAPISGVARQLHLSWDSVDGIMKRAVARGQARQEKRPPKAIAVDETSFQKRHEYVTVVSSGGIVLWVADGRKKSSLDEFYEEIGSEACEQIAEVTMDMSKSYISSTRAYVPDADARIVFDRFHVAKALGDAVNQIRRAENKELVAAGDMSLKGSRYLWLQNPLEMKPERWLEFRLLRDSNLRTAKNWAMKETALNLWGYSRRAWAERGWKNWLEWVEAAGAAPMKKIGRMILAHWTGVINAAVTTASNAIAESINSKIQKVKRMACGFRSRERFRTAIYFHLGGLNLYPDSANFSHTIS